MSTQEKAAEQLAQKFHETYERLAPQLGYETRQESAKPWSEVPEKNRVLMIATVNVVMRGAADLIDKASAEIHMLERQAESHKYAVDDLAAVNKELLEALEVMLRSFCGEAEDYCMACGRRSGSVAGCKTCAVILIGKAAIAKARGRQL